MTLFRAAIAALLLLPDQGFAQSETPAEPQIQWEIANRFAPFEVFGDRASQVFEKFQVRPPIFPGSGGDLVAWHSRVWYDARGQGQVLSSPYAEASPWSEAAQKHDDRVLKFVRAERDPDTQVRIKLWLDVDGECRWQVAGQDAGRARCRNKVSAMLPLAGGEATVDYDGSETTQALMPEHKVILGFGDSYGSGEGNPDRPTRWRAKDELSGFGQQDLTWITRSGNRVSDAEWSDHRCHRSFFSWQPLAALRLASEDPHRFVSFLHYACTGAEIFDGLLYPQWSPGGSRKKSFNSYAQVNLAMRELCTDEVAFDDLEGRIRDALGRTHRTAPTSNSNPIARSDWTFKPEIARCAGDMRVPDHVFLSIGGNDIGFADVVQYYLVPTARTRGKLWKAVVGANMVPQVCPARNNQINRDVYLPAAQLCDRNRSRLGYDSGGLIDVLPAKYDFLFGEFTSRFRVPVDRIVMPQYPDPLRRRSTVSDPCASLGTPALSIFPGDRPSKFSRFSAWNAVKVKGPGSRTLTRSNFNLTRGESRLLLRQFDSFRQALYRSAEKAGITFTCATRDAFVGHDWSRGKHLHLPNFGQPLWEPQNWDPYRFEFEGRAVRTANDSYLTQTSRRKDDFTGTAHPNLRGHTLIADGAFEALNAH